jgi:hypothetical protein
MSTARSAIKAWQIILSGLSLFLLSPLSPPEIAAQNRVIASYTLPDTPIKTFQNAAFPGSVANDRKVLLGSVGSDLWRSPKDASGEFWMLTDRGPNGQIKVDGKNRRTFWVPEFNPAILRVKANGDEIQILQTYLSSASRESP